MKTHQRLVAAALSGTLTMFAWGGFSHLVLLAGVGFSHLPNEPQLVHSLQRAQIPDGLYFFPSLELRGSPTVEERAAWEIAFRNGPTGMIVYHAAGGEPFSLRKLLIQFGSHLGASIIATGVASLLAGSLAERVRVIVALGAFGWLSISTIYWNWYGFPLAFFLAQGADMIVGWALAGTMIAWILGRE